MPKPTLYIDIDGVLLANECNLAEGAEEFIKFVADNFEVCWLTTHCMHGDAKWAIEYVNRASKMDLLPYLSKFKPTTWGLNKTDAINMKENFLWFDDDCFTGEKLALERADKLDSLVKIDLATSQYQMVDELARLKERP